MGRGLGINAVMAAAYESTYGTPPGSGYFKLAMVSHGLGEEQPLIEDDQLGFGREGLDPTSDVINNDGDLAVPVNTRGIGFWLRQTFGAPTTTGAPGTATGTITFASQPAASSTVTLNGVVFTFVAGAPTGNQVQIGGSLAATLTALVAALNASSSASVQLAAYSASSTVLTVTYATFGTLGNSFTIAASGGSNGTASAATLTGGNAASHLFTSGAASLPSTSIEIGSPDVPSFSMNYGAVVNQLKIGLARSGMLNAALSLIAQGEVDPTTSSAAGTLAALAGQRFAQATGSIASDSVTLGNVVSANLGYSNNLDKVEVIRSDGRIGGVDATTARASGDITVRLDQNSLLLNAKARSKTPVALSFGWTIGAYSLTFALPRVFLPKPKRAIQGPKGIMATFNWQASGALAAQMTATLVNDVASYA